MRSLLLASLVVLVACRGGMTADLTVKGEIDQKPVDMKIQLTSGGGAVENATLEDSAAIQLALIGGQQAYSSISAKTCPTDPCPDVAELILRTPPPIIFAGRWRLPEGSMLKLNRDLTPLTGVNLGDDREPYELDFKEPEFSGSGKVTMIQTAAVISPEGAKAQVTGSVELEYQCHIQSSYFRHCGEAKKGDGQSNPLGRAYLEDTCPRSLVEPYEASPKWDDDTLQLGELEVDCRETEGQLDGGKTPLLCYSRRTGVEADGCKWTVHFVTDGWLHQFAVAGFAEGDCAKKTCNTYR